METLQQLKIKITLRINEIEDVQLLKSIADLFDNSDANISKLVSFINDKLQNENLSEKEDFTNYIKEWVKSM